MNARTQSHAGHHIRRPPTTHLLWSLNFLIVWRLVMMIQTAVELNIKSRLGSAHCFLASLTQRLRTRIMMLRSGMRAVVRQPAQETSVQELMTLSSIQVCVILSGSLK